jgi:hypothetical protein
VTLWSLVGLLDTHVLRASLLYSAVSLFLFKKEKRVVGGWNEKKMGGW